MKGKSNSSNSEDVPILKELITNIDNSILESNGRQDNIIIELKADRKETKKQISSLINIINSDRNETKKQISSLINEIRTDRNEAKKQINSLINLPFPN